MELRRHKEERDHRFEKHQLELERLREERIASEEQRQTHKDDEEKARKESLPGQLRYFDRMVEHLLPKTDDNPAEYPAHFESVEDIFRTTVFQKTSRQN